MPPMTPIQILNGLSKRNFAHETPVGGVKLSQCSLPAWAACEKTALAPPTGPVFLSLPADILRAEGDLDLQVPTRVAPRLRGDHAAIEEAAALLAAAKRPLIIAGDAVAQSRAHVELVDLAETSVSDPSACLSSGAEPGRRRHLIQG